MELAKMYPTAPMWYRTKKRVYSRPKEKHPTTKYRLKVDKILPSAMERAAFEENNTFSSLSADNIVSLHYT